MGLSVYLDCLHLQKAIHLLLEKEKPAENDPLEKLKFHFLSIFGLKFGIVSDEMLLFLKYRKEAL